MVFSYRTRKFTQQVRLKADFRRKSLNIAKYSAEM